MQLWCFRVTKFMHFINSCKEIQYFSLLKYTATTWTEIYTKSQTRVRERGLYTDKCLWFGALLKRQLACTAPATSQSWSPNFICLGHELIIIWFLKQAKPQQTELQVSCLTNNLYSLKNKVRLASWIKFWSAQHRKPWSPTHSIEFLKSGPVQKMWEIPNDSDDWSDSSLC